MTAQPLTPAPSTPTITVQPATITLFDGSTLTITNHVPLAAAGRRTAALAAHLYCFAGPIDHPGGYLGAYLGQSHDLSGPRAANSLKHWAITQHRITPTGMALLTRPTPYTNDERRFIEARTIMTLSAAGIWMLNTHTSAGIASARLTRTQVHHGQELSTDLAQALLTHLFGGKINSHPSPCSNSREGAVRVVLHATRALDTFEVMRALRANGHTTKGRTPARSVRRDLLIREAETRGRPRVVSTWHRNRRIYWNPTTLTKRQAIRSYDVAHP
jgi:hypothetical protein